MRICNCNRRDDVLRVTVPRACACKKKDGKKAETLLWIELHPKLKKNEVDWTLILASGGPSLGLAREICG